ncbi:sigma-70 family RNA polymerase sigma factor [Ornithinibacillus halotolerans]|uniref:DNA-directed RNA polymerase sigma-70 factor n=1 Tax=Ornithinibacillus halotolerans TaxID=1274357 RepID=A0A916S448_9BACI|nr:sigma-70 family RNA polymerase sigma factor [Ornithinibacillus halotolerans]GGA80241.1 DNA-directed RNA polymerase sigma-70 factor [Ornithinibacillus halotolerans]
MSIFKMRKLPEEHDSFEQLLVNEQNKLYRIAYSYVRNEQDALDIVQDAIIKGYKSFHKLKDRSLFSTWMIRILINCALDHIRREKVVVPFEADWYIPHVNEVNQTIMSMDISHVFDQLKPNQKTIILLRFFEGYSIREIADILEKPEGTIKSQLHRTLQILKKKLESGGDVYGEASSRY